MSKFKVGDEVKVIDKYDKKYLKIFKITDIRPSFSDNLYWEKGMQTGVFESGLELVKKKEPLKYEDLIL